MQILGVRGAGAPPRPPLPPPLLLVQVGDLLDKVEREEE